MRVFVAGASGAIGRPLLSRLIAAGHEVTGTTRSEERAEAIRTAGARPVICDVLDAARAAGARRMICQSIAFAYAPGQAPARSLAERRTIRTATASVA